VELHGGMTRTERQAVEASFVKGSAQVLLATDAASEGLNLHQRCRSVINLEIPWSPVRLEQRIGRVDRIGQTRRVHALNLVAAATHEITVAGRVRERQQRATEALAAASSSDFATAALILAGAAEAPERSTVISPALTRRPDLTDRACREAEWITVARRIHTGPVDGNRRPFVAVLTRAPRRLLCVADVSASHAGDLSVWATLVGVELTGTTPLNGDLRSVVQRLDDRLSDITGVRSVAIEAIGQLRTFVALHSARERAICAAIRVRHARIAAELLQPGLFDRRAERRAAAQSSVFEEALAQCQNRLDEFARLAETVPSPARIRFAAFI
jgi:helicase-like protein